MAKTPYIDPKEMRPWILIVDREQIQETLDQTPRRYRLLVAILLSLAKWFEKSVKRQWNFECGLCVQYKIDAFAHGGCKGCPLYRLGQCCFVRDSLYQKWFEARPLSHSKASKEYAAQARELLMGMYVKEFNKQFR